MAKQALVIGGGFAGCAAAHQFSLAGGWDVTVAEAGPHLGAGVRTHWAGSHPYTQGPRHFLTQNEEVWAYLNALVPMRRCGEHEFWTYVEQDCAFYNYPIHEDDIGRMPEAERIRGELAERTYPINAANFEEFWIKSIGKTLYGKFVDRYSQKMWGSSGSRIDTFNWSPKGVTIKSGPRAAWDTAISGYPIAPNGYDDYFGLATAGSSVRLNTKVQTCDIENSRVLIDLVWHKFDVIVNTIAPDVMFEYQHGKLPFMGRDIIPIVLPVEFALPENVYFCYYAGSEKFTRVTEYKKFTRHRSPHTLITLEIPSSNGRLYPMPLKSAQAQAERYFRMMPQNVYSIGRAGSYSYAIDIDDCVSQSFEMMQQINGGGHDHPVPFRKGA